MKVIDCVTKTRDRMKKINGIDVKDILIEDPIEEIELFEIEEKLEFKFPNLLKEFYLNEASWLEFRWYADLNTFNEHCKYGELIIISPYKVLENYLDMKYEVEQVMELDINEGNKAIINDWPHWIPIIRFVNGDAFCIDKRSQNNEVVFFEHEVVEGEVNLHGLKIALDFKDLLLKWTKVGFVDIYDWYEGVNDDGIDLDKEVFKSILKIAQGEQK